MHTPAVVAPRRLIDDTPTDRHPAALLFAGDDEHMPSQRAG
jgi:hypothetical protein